MSDRTVKAILKADVSSLVNGMKSAAKATDDFAKKSTKSATDNKAQWTQLGQTSMIAGAALAVGVGLAVKAFMDFDKEMSVVKAVSGATAGEMDKLRGAALKAGADTKYSASEAAKAEGELAKVGISTADILGGALTGSLNLAAAGNLDLGQAAEISGQAMKIFNLAGKDVGHIADVLASGANKSAADVTDLGMALQQGGLVAAQTGLTLEDTVGTLAAFADNALKGSDSGTSLKTMLQRLNPQSEQAANLMDELGLRAYDASGKFVGITEYAGLLQTKLAGMTDEQRNATMQILFGSDAVRGANILYKEGAAGISEYVKAVNDQGAASRMAAVMMDNLSGDLEQLKGSIETALIQSGSGANGALRSMAQFATGAVNAFGELPASTQKGALGFAAVASAGLLTVGAIGTMYPKVVETKKVLDKLAGSSKLAGTAMSGLGKAAGIAAALTAVATAMAVISNASQKAIPGIEATTAALLYQGDSVKEVDTLFKGIGGADTWSSPVDNLSQAFRRLTDKNTMESLNDMIDGVIPFDDAAKRSAEVFNNIGTSLGNLVSSGNADMAAAQFEGMVKKLGLTGDEVNQLMTLMPAYGESLVGVENAAKMAGTGTDALSGAQTTLESETTKAKDAINAEHQALQDAGLAVLSTRAATRDFIQSQVDAKDAIEKNGRTLDIHSQKGRDNAAVLDGMATNALDLSKAVYAETGSEDAMRASLVKSRASLVETGIKFGMTKAQANTYADSVLKIPPTVKTNVALNGVPAALTAADRLIARLKLIKDKNINVHTSYTGTAPGQGHQAAAGGYITGPGTTTSDSIPAMLSHKEYVVKAKAVDYYGVDTMHAINSMRFAAGGYVGPRSSSSTPAGGGNTFQTTINEVTDPVGTAQAVARRQAMLASV